MAADVSAHHRNVSPRRFWLQFALVALVNISVGVMLDALANIPSNDRMLRKLLVTTFLPVLLTSVLMGVCDFMNWFLLVRLFDDVLSRTSYCSINS
jgi:hypothetical protein